MDTVVIGGGQAGLAASYHLQRARRQHVVLEAQERVGQSWRDRWDSLRLFTPAGFSHLPGMQFPARARSYPTKDEMAAYLREYVDSLELPVITGARVNAVRRSGRRFLIETDTARWDARCVIVATGAHGAPVIPEVSARLNPGIHQLTAAQYRCPDSLPGGAVLVVGAGNTGAEIAVELARSGRQVVLSGRDVGHIPMLSNTVFHVMRRITTGSRLGRRVLSLSAGSGGDPLGRTRRRDLARPNLVRTPKFTDVDDHGQPLFGGEHLDQAVRTLIWAVGHRPDYSWIHLPVTDSAGAITHDRGLSTEPGLAFLGLPYQRSMASHLVGGVGDDARFTVEATAT